MLFWDRKWNTLGSSSRPASANFRRVHVPAGSQRIAIADADRGIRGEGDDEEERDGFGDAVT